MKANLVIGDAQNFVVFEENGKVACYYADCNGKIDGVDVYGEVQEAVDGLRACWGENQENLNDFNTLYKSAEERGDTMTLNEWNGAPKQEWQICRIF